MQKLSIFFIVFFTFPVFVIAQGDKMETDRPSESFSPATVLKDRLQVEMGFRKEQNKNNEDEPDIQYLYPSALIKYGLAKKLELRLLIEHEADYENIPEKHKTATGLLPVKVGFKYNILEKKGLLPKTSLVARADIPGLASNDFKGDF